MAGKRMFSVKIVDTDAFTEMPNDSQLLYFRLCLAADDDGFVSNPRKVMRSFGISEDSMKILIAKKFVLVLKYNESAILLIKHWRMHNTIRKDRYEPSPYHELLQYIFLDQNKAYSLTPGEGKVPALPSHSGVGSGYDSGYDDENQIDPDLYPNGCQNGNQSGNQTVTETDPNGFQNGSTDKVRLEESRLEEISKDTELKDSNSQSIGKGDCKGKNLDLLDRCAKLYHSQQKLGYDLEGAYKFAQVLGISREALDEYLAKEGAV